uniref:Uncharacterized protein n=1 Tax=Oryza meridionalis TaxID=40149 RepID=A0A0E0CQG3_9ORYZ
MATHGALAGASAWDSRPGPVNPAEPGHAANPSSSVATAHRPPPPPPPLAAAAARLPRSTPYAAGPHPPSTPPWCARAPVGLRPPTASADCCTRRRRRRLRSPLLTRAPRRGGC